MSFRVSRLIGIEAKFFLRPRQFFSILLLIRGGITNLPFLRNTCEIITDKYIKHAMQKGKSLKIRRQFQRLYMKNPSDDFWDYAVFQHPSTFDTYALDPKRKEAIINDPYHF